jgi:2-oxoglutarate ferredoxin oxidoreductase subunit alpha
VYGDPFAPVGLVAWGSVAGVARDPLQQTIDSGISAKLLVPRLLYPVSEDVYEDFFASIRVGLVVDQSHQGQLFHLLRMFVTLPHGVSPLARSGSNPFTPSEIAGRLRDMAIDTERARMPDLQSQLD